MSTKMGKDRRADGDELSAVQRKMYDILKDGKRHPAKQLHDCLWDEGGSMQNIEIHISRIRKHLPTGMAIIREVGGHPWSYRLVRLICGDE